MSSDKSLARLRAILSRVTIAAAVTAVPATAAARAGEPSDRARPGDADLADDEALGRALAQRLVELPPGEAITAAAELALSPEIRERVVLATALASEFPLGADDVLIDHLATDDAPAVRAASARAAWARLRRDETDVLHRLLGDHDPEVRAAAWQAVRRTR